jgi:hypothetical protein
MTIASNASTRIGARRAPEVTMSSATSAHHFGHLVVVVVALVPLSLSAQRRLPAAASPWRFGGSLGLSLPTGDVSNAVNTGFNLNGLAEYRFRRSSLSLRGELVYHHFGLKTDPLVGVNGGSASAFGGVADVIYTFATAPRSLVHPYLIGGLGLYHVGANADTFLGNVDLGSQTKLGLNGGVGVEFSMRGPRPFAEVRFHTVFTDGANANFIPIAVGVKF